MRQLWLNILVYAVLVTVCSSRKAIGHDRSRRSTLVNIGIKCLQDLLRNALQLHNVYKPQWDVSFIKLGANSGAKRDWNSLPGKPVEIPAISKDGNEFMARGKLVGDRLFHLEEAYNGYPPRIIVFRIQKGRSSNTVRLTDEVEIKYLSAQGRKNVSLGN